MNADFGRYNPAHSDIQHSSKLGYSLESDQMGQIKSDGTSKPGVLA